MFVQRLAAMDDVALDDLVRETNVVFVTATAGL